MSQRELDNILQAHKVWAMSNEQRGVQAYLREAYLREADLRGADLREADLQRAALRGAYLSEADLRGANLTNVKLEGPELLGVDWLYHATVPARFLPWLSSHPHFADWFPTLTIVEE